MENLKEQSLNPAKNVIEEGISIFTACMNRADNLFKVLPSWLAAKGVDEIIILDWSSDKSIRSILNDFNDDRLILVEASHYKKWILSKAYNLAASMTSKNKIFKCDTDVYIKEDFFEKHKLRENTFFAGNWRNAVDDNEAHLNGMNYTFRKDFFGVNGYNELIKTYGWDDDDLYKRLEEYGLKRLDIDHEQLYHIPHQNRLDNQYESTMEEFGFDSQRAKIKIAYNRILTDISEPWGTDFRTDEYDVRPIDKNLLSCKLTTESNYESSPENIRSAKIGAIREYIWQMRSSLPLEFIKTISDDEYLELFRLFFESSKSKDELLLLRLLTSLRSSAPDVESIYNEIYSTWTWKTGSAIRRVIVFLFGWHPKYKKIFFLN